MFTVDISLFMVRVESQIFHHNILSIIQCTYLCVLYFSWYQHFLQRFSFVSRYIMLYHWVTQLFFCWAQIVSVYLNSYLQVPYSLFNIVYFIYYNWSYKIIIFIIDDEHFWLVTQFWPRDPRIFWTVWLQYYHIHIIRVAIPLSPPYFVFVVFIVLLYVFIVSLYRFYRTLLLYRVCFRP